MKKNNLSAFAKGLVIASLSSVLVASCNNDENNTSKVDSTANTDVSMDTTKKADTMAMAMDTATVPMVKAAKVNISATYPDTTVTGMANFTTAADGKIKMTLEITVPSKAGKSVAVHFHEHGDCGDNGKSSHGHWNPTKEDHGKWDSSPHHRGDIGNVKLDGTGKGSISMETDVWTLGGKTDKNILGKALIVHGGVDDYKTQPTGNAGSRIGCGVIQ